MHRVLISQATHHSHDTKKNSASVNISIQISQWGLHPARVLAERHCVFSSFPFKLLMPLRDYFTFEHQGGYYSSVWWIEIWSDIYVSLLPDSGRKLRQLAAEASCAALVSVLFSVALFNHELLIIKSQQWLICPTPVWGEGCCLLRVCAPNFVAISWFSICPSFHSYFPTAHSI